MVNPLVRRFAALIYAVALSFTSGLARADEADEPSAPKSIEDYEEAIAEQESRVLSLRDGNAGNGARARLRKLRANYERDVESYSVPATVAGVILTIVGTAGTVFGLAVEAGTKGGGSWDMRGSGLLFFAAPSVLGGVVPGFILITVGSRPVLRPQPPVTRVTLSLAPGGLAGTF